MSAVDDVDLIVTNARFTTLDDQRQHVRVTKHDQSQEALARAFHVGPEGPRVRHYLFAERSRERSESSLASPSRI